MFCKLHNEKVVLSHQRYQVGTPLTQKNPVPRRLLEIKTTPPYGYPCLISALKPILIVTLAGICETFESDINDMSHNTHFTIIDLLDPNHYNLSNKDLNTSADELEHRWNINLISYDTLTARTKPNGQWQLTKRAWSFTTFEESHRYQ
ncbi:hypothetical protein BDD12DRAFT_811081 [Trichophaea hybrida]|nr:hypothetical protein BDD12DRAFT_811081 [Trichophaea hybrida]